MNYTPEEIQEVRDISIASTLNAQLNGRKVMVACPMPGHDDGTPSFLIDDENCFHCFGCSAKGSGFIDFISEFLRQEGQTDEKEIFKQVMEEYAG